MSPLQDTRNKQGDKTWPMRAHYQTGKDHVLRFEAMAMATRSEDRVHHAHMSNGKKTEQTKTQKRTGPVVSGRELSIWRNS